MIAPARRGMQFPDLREDSLRQHGGLSPPAPFRRSRSATKAITRRCPRTSVRLYEMQARLDFGVVTTAPMRRGEAGGAVRATTSSCFVQCRRNSAGADGGDLNAPENAKLLSVQKNFLYSNNTQAVQVFRYTSTASVGSSLVENFPTVYSSSSRSGEIIAVA